MVVREVRNNLGREELEFSIQSNDLTVLLDSESFRCPAMALERSVGISDHKVLSLTFHRGYLIVASVEKFDRTLDINQFSRTDMVRSKPKSPVGSFRSIQYGKSMHSQTCFRICLTFSPYDTRLVRTACSNKKAENQAECLQKK